MAVAPFSKAAISQDPSARLLRVAVGRPHHPALRGARVAPPRSAHDPVRHRGGPDGVETHFHVFGSLAFLATATIPVIFLTGSSDIETKVHVFDLADHGER